MPFVAQGEQMGDVNIISNYEYSLLETLKTIEDKLSSIEGNLQKIEINEKLEEESNFLF